MIAKEEIGNIEKAYNSGDDFFTKTLDKTLNLRISQHELSMLREAAEKDGYKTYQKWVRHKLAEAVAKTLDINLCDDCAVDISQKSQESDNIFV